MTEIGEGVSVTVDKPEKPKKGSIKVVVKDICSGDALEGVEVEVGGKKQKTNASGEASFKQLSVGPENVKVKAHFKDADYSTFYVHYPKVLSDHEAKSSDFSVELVEADKETVVEFELEVYKTLGDIVLHRRHIDIGGEDKYGHWWTVVNAGKSYGWWPKYPMGSQQNQTSQPPQPPTPLPANAGIGQTIQYKFEYAVYMTKLKAWEMKESSLVQTLRGAEGELNGQTSFGGTSTMDPHHIHDDEGDEQYQPVRWDCFSLPSIESDITNFANTYSGGWSWRFEAGNHCHTFQKKLMKDLNLDNVKVLK